MNNLDALKMAYMSQMAKPTIASGSMYGKPVQDYNGLAINPYTSVGYGDEWHNQLGREQIYLPRTDAMSYGGVGSGDTRQTILNDIKANMTDDDYNRLLEIMDSLPMGDYGKI